MPIDPRDELVCMAEWKRVLAERMKVSRAKAGMTQKELAKWARVSPQTVIRCEDRTAIQPTVHHLRCIAYVLQVSLDWLVGLE